MLKCLFLAALCITASHQAIAASGNALISFSKFDYTNQTMGDLGLPEDNYSPSNFYTVSIARRQRVVSWDNREHIRAGYKRHNRKDFGIAVPQLYDQRFQALQNRHDCLRFFRTRGHGGEGHRDGNLQNSIRFARRVQDHLLQQ